MSQNVDEVNISECVSIETNLSQPWNFDSIELKRTQIDSLEAKDWIHPLLVHNKIIPFKLDTGAQTNVLLYEDYKGIKEVKLHCANETLRCFTGDQVQLEGKCVLSVTWKRHLC